ncbi:MAG: amidohydrolase/deacetylase family metallohydrolase [Bryobacteraceae bacterium]|nr:amidohydrolase/deacetylase family metallohydrolase [Bryobacteraceae bacterium]
MSILCLLAFSSVNRAQSWDLLIQGGRLIDPRNSIDAPRDVAVAQGRIAAVGENLDPKQAKKVIDAKGLLVTPGAVDIHVHAFHTTGAADAWAGDKSISPDSFSFRTCTTTMSDAGSAGWRNFETFRHSVIDRTRTRLYAMINIAGYGMMGNINEQVEADFNPDAVAKLARKHSDVVVGVKTAHYEKPAWTSVDQAIAAGKLTNLPVMVDFGYFLKERPYWQLVTEKLRPGDISTHVYRSAVPFFDEKNQLLPYLNRARERGVKFDVGHGGGSFVFRSVAPAVAQGFWPDTISTDLHAESMNAGMQDLPTTMSKFLALGMPLREIVARATWLPAQVIRREQHGHLTVGAPADIALWQVQQGDFGFTDSHGGVLRGRRRLACEMTILNGTVEWDLNGRNGTDYRQLPPDYGMRPGADFLVRPPR